MPEKVENVNIAEATEAKPKKTAAKKAAVEGEVKAPKAKKAVAEGEVKAETKASKAKKTESEVAATVAKGEVKAPKAKKAEVAATAVEAAPKAKKAAIGGEVEVVKAPKAKKAVADGEAAKAKPQGQKTALYIDGRFVVEKDFDKKPQKGTRPYELTNNKIKVTLVKSTNGCLSNQIKTVEALGLKKIRQSVVVLDNAAIRGMIFRVRHLVTVEEVK